MCYAIPAKVLEIQDGTAKVDYGGVSKHVNISLMEKCTIGDYVLIHAGFAIEKLDKRSAEETLQIIRSEMSKAKESETENLRMMEKLDPADE